VVARDVDEDGSTEDAEEGPAMALRPAMGIGCGWDILSTFSSTMLRRL
jgi:hypothetical protein